MTRLPGWHQKLEFPVGHKDDRISQRDRVELRCHATVMRTTIPFLVAIALDASNGGYELAVPPTTLILPSDPPKLTLEERMELPIDDELLGAVQGAIHQMVGPDGVLEEGLDEVALAAIDAVYSRGVEEKRVEHFEKGNCVEFKCEGTITAIAPASAIIMLERIGCEMNVPVTTLTNLTGREMTLEEAMELDMDDELLGTVTQVITRMVAPDGSFSEPLEKVAQAATDAVYNYHRTFYSRTR